MLASSVEVWRTPTRSLIVRRFPSMALSAEAVNTEIGGKTGKNSHHSLRAEQPGTTAAEVPLSLELIPSMPCGLKQRLEGGITTKRGECGIVVS